VYLGPVFSHYEYKFLLGLFFWDSKTVLFGLLYCLGFMCLIFYSTGIILTNHGNFGTPFEKHSKLFFKLSVILLLTFEVLMYFHFINPPYFLTGWFSFFWDSVWIYGWKIYIGYILGAIMIGMVAISFIYDQIMLRRHYQNYLPEHMPQKDQDFNEFE
jgi:hypothetical protein